jgi:hypothetical protein
VRGRLGHTRRWMGRVVGHARGGPWAPYPSHGLAQPPSGEHQGAGRDPVTGETRAKPTVMGLGHPCRDEVALAARSATGAEECACGQRG